MTAQLIYLTLVFIGALIAANQHGKDKTGKHDFFTSIIAQILVMGLLYWGGFFDVLLK